MERLAIYIIIIRATNLTWLASSLFCQYLSSNSPGALGDSINTPGTIAHAETAPSAWAQITNKISISINKSSQIKEFSLNLNLLTRYLFFLVPTRDPEKKTISIVRQTPFRYLKKKNIKFPSLSRAGNCCRWAHLHTLFLYWYLYIRLANGHPLSSCPALSLSLCRLQEDVHF